MGLDTIKDVMMVLQMYDLRDVGNPIIDGAEVLPSSRVISVYIFESVYIFKLFSS